MKDIEWIKGETKFAVENVKLGKGDQKFGYMKYLRVTKRS